MTMATCPRCGGEYSSSNEHDHNGIHGPGTVNDLPARPDVDNGCPVQWCGTMLEHYHDEEGYVRFEKPK